ncbi:vWA domain-containing protein [Paucihalobacter sp.]|uniref:vWA domain-containing protein n=1 Tax=Paucihalobacter sp. TaxID=2850405 RepID=UPI003D1620B6
MKSLSTSLQLITKLSNQLKSLFTLLFLIGAIFSMQSQETEAPAPILFIYDASGSMWAQMEGKTRVEIAREVLSTSVNNLPAHQKIGLMAYGHRKKGDCSDVELIAGIENTSKEKVVSAIKKISPIGMTPLAQSAIMAIDQLRKSKTSATIILVTDGIESCGGNICDVIAAAKKEGIDFKLHIIGFGLKEGETEQLRCAAKAGDGNYYDAADAGGLGSVLNEAVAQTVEKPKANFTIYALKNGIAIDAAVMTYDVVGKRTPIGVRTYKDTATVFLPPSTYNIEVTPLEGSDVDKITITGVTTYEDKIVHRDVSFDGGKLSITTTNNGENWDCTVKVFDTSGKVAANIRTYDTPKEVEVNPGTYNVQIQALAMDGIETTYTFENVIISSTNSANITHNFKTGKAVIESFANGNSIDSTVNLKEVSSGKAVSGARTYGREREFLLNPGTYEVKVMPLGDFKDRKTQTFTITVKQGETTSKKVNF